MDRDTNVKDEVIVEIDESQLDLPMEKKDDLELEVKPEAKTEDVKVEAEKKERKRHNDDIIKSLEAQIRDRDAALTAEREARSRAEEAARAKAAEASDAKNRAVNSEYDNIKGKIAEANAHELRIKRELKQALEMGENDKFTDLQMEAARVAARKMQYEDAKAIMEERASRVDRERPKEEEVRPSSDPFETAIASMSAKSQAYLRQHRECVMDPEMNAKVVYGHQVALKKGIRPDSPEYFAFLDTHMGYADVNSDDDGEDQDVEVQTQRNEGRKPMASAPVSRDSHRQNGFVSPGKYRLSREEADMAEQMGMSPTEYATYKLKGQKEGRWTN
jgi:hypothetical protein